MVLKELILQQFLVWEGVVHLARTDFGQFLLWEGVLVSQELTF